MVTVTSPDYFLINGVSSETVGLYTDTPPVPPLAMQRVTVWNTGVDMDGYSPDNVFENIQISIRAFTFFPETFNCSSVYAFLANAKTLMFSRFPNRFLKVVQVDAVQPEHSYDGKRIELNITFTCEPFKYHTANAETTVTNNRIDNPGTRYSRPIYKLTIEKTAYDAVLQVNGQNLTIDRAADSPIWIDTERMIAYDSETENQTQLTNGMYPFLSPGANTVVCYTFVGNNLVYHTVQITGNWRDY